MILSKLIRYTNAHAIEATWVDEAGQVVKCQAYANSQMDMLAADLGDDAAQHQALMDAVAATYVEPEPAPPAVPASVTMRQARLALLGAGKLAAVAAALDSLPEPARSAATIEWEYSNEVLRHNGFVLPFLPHGRRRWFCFEAIAAALGMAGAHKLTANDLFRWAEMRRATESDPEKLYG